MTGQGWGFALGIWLRVVFFDLSLTLPPRRRRGGHGGGLFTTETQDAEDTEFEKRFDSEERENILGAFAERLEQ